MGTILAEETVISADPDVVSSSVGDGVMLLDLKQSRYYSLNAVGSLIWERLAEPSTVVQLTSAVLGEFEVEPQRCRADVESLVSKLHEAGLVHVHAGTA